MTTELPKAYTPAAIEAEAYRVWTAERAFHAEPGDGGEPYAIVIPPPNVTAALHLGHALNNTIQDVLTRYHRMLGDNTCWLPGTDHAGIATQTVVDKRLQAAGEPALKDYKRMEAAGEGGRERFIAKVQAWKDEYEARIIDQLKRMGCSCDWDRLAFTMDGPRARAVREAFFRLFKDGLIYRGKRLVNWDPVSQTALADDEVEMEEVDGHFYYLRYPLTEDPERAASVSERSSGACTDNRSLTVAARYVTVATTRPETMLGDTAVAINPKDPRAAALRGRKVVLPIVNREIPIVEDEYVVMPVQFGGDPADVKAQMATGFLKVTPAHDPNDYEIGRRHNLAAINVMAPDGSISDKHGWTDVGDAGFLLGKSREEARKLVVEWFKANGLLEDVKPYRHSVGHSYRSHVPIEPYLSDQWYCKVTDERMAGAALLAMSPERRDDGEGRSRDREGAGHVPTELSSNEGKPLPNGRGSLAGSFPLAYFITFTTYGAWLHGDDRGSADREHNVFGTPYLTGDEARERREFDELKHPPASLDEPRRRVVRDTIAEVCRHRGWILHVAHVRPKHVHLVLSADVPPEKVMNDLKSYATRRMREAGLVDAEERVWTRHGSTRYLFTDEARVAASEYVHDRQGAPIEPPPLFGSDLAPASGAGPRSRERERVEGANPSPAQPLPDGRGSLSLPSEWEGKLRFYPSRYARTFQTWHENIRDWCISRQLWWGHRIPVWSKRRRTEELREGICISGQPALTDDAVKAAGEREVFRIKDGPEFAIWRQFDGDEFVEFVSLQPGFPAFERDLERGGYTQDPDVLDTWFSSGLWPMSTLNWPEDTPELQKWNPSDVLTTAREIITLWVSRMVMFNLYFRDCLPFTDVFIHAMIQDGEGQKMSKTLGNGVDPLDIIESHGADAMRFTLAAMTTHTQDLRMPVDLVCPHSGETFTPKKVTLPNGYVVAAPIQESPKMPGKRMVSSFGMISGQSKPTSEMPLAKNTSSKFDEGRKFCNKIWQVARNFVIANVAKVPPEPVDELKWSMADRWIVSRLNRTVATADEMLAQYRFDQYAKSAYDFVWGDFCDWYVEAGKPALRDPARAGQTANVLAAVLDASLRLLHPVMPFITETIWWSLNEARPERGLPGRIDCLPSPRLIKAKWPTVGSFAEAAEHIFPKLQDVVTAIRNVRNQYKVDVKKRVTVSIMAPGDASRQVNDAKEMIELLATCTLKDVRPDLAPIEKAARVQAAGCEIYLEGLVDEAAEGQRSAKREAELAKQEAALLGRLANESYTAKAPPHLVQQTRDQLAAVQAELKKLRG